MMISFESERGNMTRLDGRQPCCPTLHQNILMCRRSADPTASGSAVAFEPVPQPPSYVDTYSRQPGMRVCVYVRL